MRARRVFCRSRFSVLHSPPCTASTITARTTSEPVVALFFAAIRSPLDAVHRAAGELRGVAEIALDAQQLVVLRDAIGAARAAGLDLARVRGDREIGDERVLGLAASMRNDGLIAVHARHLDRLEGLGHGADLVQLDQDRVRDILLDAAAEE